MFQKLLIANRGEIAIRIARAAAELDIPTLSIYSQDDSESLHRYRSTESVALSNSGPAAYLDVEQILSIARQNQCDAIHPGYGFLSENASFAQACVDAGITFIGPSVECLTLFGDKVQARQFASEVGIPLLEGTQSASTLAQVKAFFAAQNNQPIIIKAIAGGGGRGMRVVSSKEEIDSAFERCQSEAKSAFGNDQVYVESFIPNARHIEVQIVADNHGNVIHLWERDCTIQRRHQKIIEVAPSPKLDPSLRQKILDAAVLMATKSRYSNLGTFEFLVDDQNQRFVFMEANPRLQVEHTITEQVTAVDLVTTQIQLSAGKTLADVGLTTPPPCRGFAIQARINMETIDAEGNLKPQGGCLTTFASPAGPGVRVDTFGYSGYTTNPNFDSLLAKIICSTHTDHWSALIKKTRQTLTEFDSGQVKTNRELLWAILGSDEIENWSLHTRWVDENLSTLLAQEKTYISNNGPVQNNSTSNHSTQNQHTFASGEHPVPSPLQGTVVKLQVASGDKVHRGQELLILESMKMEHVITAPVSGIVGEIVVARGDTLFENAPLLGIIPSAVENSQTTTEAEADPTVIRPDLQEVIDRHTFGYDEARPDAVAKRRKTGQRTARENIKDLCDNDSFKEYGPLVIAAQRARRSLQELIEKTPGDGLIGGMGTINAELFGKENTQCVAMTYDYTVFAGTQGQKNHRKKDRLFELAGEWKLPVVVFAEGGGGRPGESERSSASGLDCLAFWYYAKLKGQCPLVGIVSGRCFAGNAVLLGCSDVIIATENANIGMGGPAMIEGGGLGIFKPEEVGPVEHQRVNGVIDIVVKDEAEAVIAAKKYLGFFQGSLENWDAPDQNLLRTVIPENRLRVYDVRRVIELMSDTDSVLELRKDFAPGMVTSFARIEGKPVGIIANNPMHLGGAIDSDCSDKAARFVQLCNAFNIPILFLCDTPGIMVGPDAEKTGLVRHAARLFIAGAAATVPFFTIVLRKAYGLGAQTMAGGSFKAAFFTVSWPTGEFGGMGLEGAVRLGYRNEIAAIEDPDEREAYFQEKVAAMYELGKATNVASYFDLDDVIDPSESRAWIVRGLEATASRKDRGSASPYIDTW